MKVQIYFSIFLHFFNSFLIHLTNSASLDDKINTVEADVKKLVTSVETTFNTRCSNSKIDCVFLACDLKLPDLNCNNNFIIDECKTCQDKKQGIMTRTGTIVKLANVYEPKTDANSIGVRELILSGKNLTPLFKTMLDKNPDFYKWMYFGSTEGSHYRYPGTVSCSIYDNRFRPWYIGAATGAKNFIMVLDVSGSMQSSGKIEGLKIAVKLLIKTLTNADWVGLITFSSDAKYYKNKLIRATAANLKELQTYIDGMEATGSTNFSDAFNKSDQMIKDTIADENGVPCKTFIMFLTDGIPTEGITNTTSLLNYIDSLQFIKSAIIFSYSFGQGAGTEIPSKIACINNGIFETIETAGEIVEKMNSYFLTLLVGIETINPVWVEPYLDADGLGLMTTCALPVYDRSKTDEPFLIGVVGIDVMMQDLYNLGDKKTVDNKLIQRSMQACTKSVVSKCQLNSIRKPKFACSLTVGEKCNALKSSISYCAESIGDVFCNTVDTNINKEDINKCCADCKSSEVGKNVGIVVGDSKSSEVGKIVGIVVGDSKSSEVGKIVGIVVGVIVVLVIIIVIIVLYKQGKICQKEVSDGNHSPNLGQGKICQTEVSDRNNSPNLGQGNDNAQASRGAQAANNIVFYQPANQNAQPANNHSNNIL